jgi:hypothetical protein
MYDWPQFRPGQPYRTWNPPMPQVYVPHQLVHPYMEVYPAPAMTRLRPKDGGLWNYRMGSPNRAMVPQVPVQHQMPPVPHTAPAHLRSMVRRPGWSHELWDEDDYTIDDLMDDLGLDEDEVMGFAMYGAAAKEAAKTKKPFQPFKMVSELFTKKSPEGKTQAEQIVAKTAKAVEAFRPPPPPPPVVVEKKAEVPWKAIGIGVASVAALSVVGFGFYKMGQSR